MKTKLLFTSLLAFAIAGVFIGIKAAQGNDHKFTLVQETRTTDGALVATELTIHNNGRHYYRYTDAQNGSEKITILTDSGGYMNNRDEHDPKKLVLVRGAGRLMTNVPSLEMLAKNPDFVRFDQYQGFTVAVLQVEGSEQWFAPEFWPKPLKVVMAGKTTETIEMRQFINNEERKVFEVK